MLFQTGKRVGDTPVLVVSRAGCADELTSDHALQDLGAASVLHAGRPTAVSGVMGSTRVGADGEPGRSVTPPQVSAVVDNCGSTKVDLNP